MEKRTTMEKMDRRSQRSRQLITEALLDLLMERKFNEITIQEITDTANVGRATFYLHYSNKEECLFQLLKGGFDSLIAEMDQMTFTRDREFVEILEKVFQFTTKNRKLYTALLSDSPRVNIMGDVQAYIQEKMLRAVPIPQTLPPVLHKAIGVNLTGSMIAMVLWWLREEPPISARQAALIFVNLAQDGLKNISPSKLNMEQINQAA